MENRRSGKREVNLRCVVRRREERTEERECLVRREEGKQKKKLKGKKMSKS